jgi:hypothetical protein
MIIETILLKELLVTVLAFVGQGALVSLEMIVHSILLIFYYTTYSADILPSIILLIFKYH